MILLDTNVIVDAMDNGQANHQWAKRQIEEAVAAEGGGISVVTLAELCAGARNPVDVEPEIRRWGLTSTTSGGGGFNLWSGLIAAMSWRGGTPRRVVTQNAIARFFIGAQAEVMG